MSEDTREQYVEGLTPGSSLVSELRKKVRSKKRLLDATMQGGVRDSAAGVRGIKAGMNIEQKRMMQEIE
jgi:hypothetical protein